MSTHDDLQEQIIQLGQVYGWRHLHVRRTVGRGRKWVTATNIKGWPDLFFWHPQRGGAFFAELKVPPDDLRPEQEACLAELRRAGFRCYVWTPADLEPARQCFDQLRGTDGLVSWMVKLVAEARRHIVDGRPDDALILLGRILDAAAEPEERYVPESFLVAYTAQRVRQALDRVRPDPVP